MRMMDTGRTCPQCGGKSQVPATEEQERAWDNGRGGHVQMVFSNLAPEEREMLLTGLHPRCFDEFLGPEEDYE